MNLSPGGHTLTATAQYPVGGFSNTASSTFTVNGDGGVTNSYDGAGYPVGGFSNTASSTFTVNGDGGVTNTYDGAGYVTNRAFADGGIGETQSLRWDAAGRLVRVVQRDTSNDGFDWVAIYDALGRRLRTYQTNIVSGAMTTVQTNNSYFDPEVEFEEVGVAVDNT